MNYMLRIFQVLFLWYIINDCWFCCCNFQRTPRIVSSFDTKKRDKVLQIIIENIDRASPTKQKIERAEKRKLKIKSNIVNKLKAILDEVKQMNNNKDSKVTEKITKIAEKTSQAYKELDNLHQNESPEENKESVKQMTKNKKNDDEVNEETKVTEKIPPPPGDETDNSNTESINKEKLKSTGEEKLKEKEEEKVSIKTEKPSGEIIPEPPVENKENPKQNNPDLMDLGDNIELPIGIESAPNKVVTEPPPSSMGRIGLPFNNALQEQPLTTLQQPQQQQTSTNNNQNQQLLPTQIQNQQPIQQPQQQEQQQQQQSNNELQTNPAMVNDLKIKKFPQNIGFSTDTVTPDRIYTPGGVNLRVSSTPSETIPSVDSKEDTEVVPNVDNLKTKYNEQKTSSDDSSSNKITNKVNGDDTSNVKEDKEKTQNLNTQILKSKGKQKDNESNDKVTSIKNKDLGPIGRFSSAGETVSENREDTIHQGAVPNVIKQLWNEIDVKDNKDSKDGRLNKPTSKDLWNKLAAKVSKVENVNKANQRKPTESKGSGSTLLSSSDKDTTQPVETEIQGKESKPNESAKDTTSVEEKIEGKGSGIINQSKELGENKEMSEPKFSADDSNKDNGKLPKKPKSGQAPSPTSFDDGKENLGKDDGDIKNNDKNKGENDKDYEKNKGDNNSSAYIDTNRDKSKGFKDTKENQSDIAEKLLETTAPGSETDNKNKSPEGKVGDKNISPESKTNNKNVSPESKNDDKNISPESKANDKNVSPESKADDKNISPESKTDDNKISPESKIDDKNISPEGKVDDKNISPESKTDDKNISPESKTDDKNISPESKTDDKNISPESKTDDKNISPESKVDDKNISPKIKTDDKNTSPESKVDDKNISPESKTDDKNISPESKTDDKNISPESKTDDKNGGNIKPTLGNSKTGSASESVKITDDTKVNSLPDLTKDSKENSDSTSKPTATTTTTPSHAYPSSSHLPAMKTGQDFCANKHTGSYPNSMDCTKYWVCAAGNRYTAQCPQGLVYNYQIYSCDDPNSIPLIVNDYYWATCDKKTSIMDNKIRRITVTKSQPR